MHMYEFVCRDQKSTSSIFRIFFSIAIHFLRQELSKTRLVAWPVNSKNPPAFTSTVVGLKEWINPHSIFPWMLGIKPGSSRLHESLTLLTEPPSDACAVFRTTSAAPLLKRTWLALVGEIRKCQLFWMNATQRQDSRMATIVGAGSFLANALPRP